MRKLGHREVKCPASGQAARITAQIFLILRPVLLTCDSNIARQGCVPKEGDSWDLRGVRRRR